MEQNIIQISRKPKKKYISTDSHGRGVIKINPDAVEALELFLGELEGMDISITRLASNFIVFASKNTIIKED